MINLVPNANNIARREVESSAFSSFFDDACEEYSNGRDETFINNIQVLITKLGIIMSKVSTNHKHISYCHQAMKYLCLEVLNNPSLLRTLERLRINENGNKGKHTNDEIVIYNNEVVRAFNQLVDSLYNQYHLTVLSSLNITRVSTTHSSSNSNASGSHSGGSSGSKPSSGGGSNSGGGSSSTQSKPPKPGAGKKKDEFFSARMSIDKGPKGRFTQWIFFKKIKKFDINVEFNLFAKKKIRYPFFTVLKIYQGDTLIKKKIVFFKKHFAIHRNLKGTGGKVRATLSSVYFVGFFQIKTLKVKAERSF